MSKGGTEVLVNIGNIDLSGKGWGQSKNPPTHKERKDYMSLETRLIKLKLKYDKLALREPRSAQQVLHRMIWERLRNILIKRYERYE